MIGLGAPRRKAATAAPLAPVPEESVSPTPRSKIRARTRLPSTRKKETLVRFGKSSWASIGGPISARSSDSSPSPTSIAHCGLPIETCWKAHSRPPALSVPTPSGPPDGKSFEVVDARPISTEQVRSEVIVGVIGPATVPIENVSSSVQPCRRRYRIASRAPFPDSSASDPSGLKIRSEATKAGSSLRESSSTPSAPIPK